MSEIVSSLRFFFLLMFRSLAQHTENDHSIPCLRLWPHEKPNLKKSNGSLAAARLPFGVITARVEHEGVSSQGESLKCITAVVRSTELVATIPHMHVNVDRNSGEKKEP